MLSDRELLSAVQDAADDYTVYGELGRQGDALAALLASERAGGRLVILMVQSVTSSTGELELSIDVKTELDARVPDGGTKCPACGVTLRPWVRFCTRCGHDVAGKGAVTDSERDELRIAVMSAVEAEYEYLGSIRRSEGGGDVFFARERTSGRIAALRLNRSAADGEYELGETNILRQAPVVAPSAKPLFSVTQILRKLEPDDVDPVREAASRLVAREASRGVSQEASQGAGRDIRRPATTGAGAGQPTAAAPSPPPSAPWAVPRVTRTMVIAGVAVIAVLAILTILVLQ